jgi:hypothetical protein
MRRLWLSVCCSLGLLSGACSSDCVLDDDLARFAGDDATDCGSVEVGKDRSKVDACATAAFEAKHAFIARYQTQGEDSRLITAVAMSSAGKVRFFRWDSSPSGSGSPATDVQTCEDPTLDLMSGVDPGILPIGCSALGAPERICGG